MKGVKGKNPESKVEGTFKIRGEFSRHNPHGKKLIRNKALFFLIKTGWISVEEIGG